METLEGVTLPSAPMVIVAVNPGGVVLGGVVVVGGVVVAGGVVVVGGVGVVGVLELPPHATALAAATIASPITIEYFVTPALLEKLTREVEADIPVVVGTATPRDVGERGADAVGDIDLKQVTARLLLDPEADQGDVRVVARDAR